MTQSFRDSVTQCFCLLPSCLLLFDLHMLIQSQSILTSAFWLKSSVMFALSLFIWWIFPWNQFCNTHAFFITSNIFWKNQLLHKNVWFFWSNNLNKFKTLKQWLHLLSLIMRLPIQKMPKPELSSSSLSWNQDYWIFLDSNLQIALFFMLLSISPTCLD